MPDPLSLHVPEPEVRPGRHARFLQREDSRGRGACRGPRSMSTRRHPRSRLFDHPRAQPRRRGGRPLGRPADRRGTARGPAPHDDAARLRRAHADGAAAGQDLVLHAASGRGGGQLRLPQGAVAGRHELPDLSPGRPADRRRLSDGRHDEPDLLQRARPAEGPAAAGHVFVEGARLLLDLRQSRARSTSRRSAGRWPRRSRTTPRSPPPGSATARRRNRISTRRWSSPRPTRRRSSSTSSTTSGRSRPSRASPAAAPAPLRRAASASAFRRCGSTATTISPSMRSRNGRPSGRGAISGRR